MIIENCCCHKQLPKLADDSFGRVMPYHTNGDVVLENVMRAVSPLCGKSVVTLIVPEVNFRLAQILKHGHDRRWWTHFNILTAVAAKNLEEVPDTTEVIALNVTEASQMLILEGESGRLALSGYHPLISPTDSKKPYQLVCHSFLYQKTNAYDDNLWNEMVKIPTAKLRVSIKR